MFVAISNTPRDYAWGSTSAIAELLGTPASGGPEAELWLGAHPGSPSRIVRPEEAGGARDLAAWIQAEPDAALGGASADGPRLPFLLKVLAAASPLSLQAHPTPEQALAGFERENAAGIPLDAPQRNYKDAFHKPELIVAVSERFEALAGFRPVAESRAIVGELLERDAAADAPRPELLAPLSERLAGEQPLRDTVEWLLRGGRDDADVAALVGRVVTLAAAETGGGFDREFATVGRLAEAYPGDPGIVLSLLLNRLSLRAGQAAYLPAGNIHAYLDGLGVELMATSDNVLRGGLTPKHIDVDELLTVLDFSPVADPVMVPEHPAPGVTVFRPDVPDFVLYEVEATDAAASVPVAGPAIALVTAGVVELRGAVSATTVSRGEAVYVTPDERELAIAGAGTVFVATTGR